MGAFIVFFDGQLWVGLATRRGDGEPEVARVVFGPEPSDAELAAWARDEFRALDFAPTRVDVAEARTAVSPKRRQREARRALEEPRARTRAQEAWCAALEATKAARLAERRATRSADAEQRYALRVEKRKQRQRGK